MCDTIKEPSECSKEEMEKFYQLVLKSGEVEISGLRNRIKRAKLLAFHYEEDTIVGIAALKRPNEPYKKRIFRKAGVSEESVGYNLEIGWAFTMCEYRGKGICSGLVQKILDAYGRQSIFATTKTDNSSMQRVLEKNGFQKTGKPYEGRFDGYYLQLFIRSKA